MDYINTVTDMLAEMVYQYITWESQRDAINSSMDRKDYQNQEGISAKGDMRNTYKEKGLAS